MLPWITLAGRSGLAGALGRGATVIRGAAAARPAPGAWGLRGLVDHAAAPLAAGRQGLGCLAVVAERGKTPVLAVVVGQSSNGNHVTLEIPSRRHAQFLVQKKNVLHAFAQPTEGAWAGGVVMDLQKQAADLATQVSEEDLRSLADEMLAAGWTGGAGERGAAAIEAAAARLFGSSSPDSVYAAILVLSSPGAARFFLPLEGNVVRARSNTDDDGGWPSEREPAATTCAADGGREGALFTARLVARLEAAGFPFPPGVAQRARGSVDGPEGGAVAGFSEEGYDAAALVQLENVGIGSSDLSGLPVPLQRLLLDLYTHGVGGGRLDGTATAILRAARVWADGDNIHLRRTPLVLDHAPRAVAAAERALSHPREDALAHVRSDMECSSFAIDEALTAMDIDDAVGFEVVDGEEWVHVHVADAGAVVALGGELDACGRERCSTVYLPERVFPMFPEGLSRNALSLVEGRTCLAVTFSACLNPDGSIKDSRVWASRLLHTRQTTYAQVDAALNGGGGGGAGWGGGGGLAAADVEVLRALERIAERRRAFRKSRGSLGVRIPRPDVRLEGWGGGGEVQVCVTRAEDGGVARGLVEECMLIAGQVAAGYAQARRIPFLFRAQVAGGRLPVEAVEGESEAAFVARQLQQLSGMPPAFNLPVPAPHRGLGLPGYAQVTSPIRRYADLLLHHQIRASLGGLAPPLKGGELSSLASKLDHRVSAINRLQRSSERFWVLEFLRRNPGPWPANILPFYKNNTKSGLRTVGLLISELGLIQHIPPPPGNPPAGARVMATVSHVDPHRAELQFKIVI